MTDHQPPVPIACTLTPSGAADRLEEWRRLRHRALRIEPVGSGSMLVFAAEMFGEVADLAGREAECCAFLNLDVTRSSGEVRLEITSDQPDAAGVIALLAGPTY